MAKSTILLVEDEEVQRAALAAHLELEHYTVVVAGTAEQALEIAKVKTIDAVITDFSLPKANGQYVLEKIREINPTIPLILITGYGSVDSAVNIMKMGAYDYLTKPINVDEMLIILKRALEHKTLISENVRLHQTLEKEYSFEGIIAASQKMQEVLNMAGRVAGTKATALLRGESGTGKEIMARAIHYSSPRKDKPFIAFNVAAFSPTLIENELFGHEKGAFTGADKARIGRFEQADEGTIFIDEIGDIPVELQSKFLRVLQENFIQHLGGNKQINVDIRVVAATNKNLEEMIKRGTFREDLYYRLNVMTISIPPLRERKEDVPLLLSHFLKKSEKEIGKEIKGFSREAFDILMKYDFPGNVRELENIVARSIILCRGEQITLDDLPLNVFSPSEKSATQVLSGLEQQVEALERNLIVSELRRCGGNQSQVARNLKITDRKLRYKIKKYGLQ
jgi:two-component system NtrC family response regulator